MKIPLRAGAAFAPKRQFPIHMGQPQAGKARRVAGLSAAAAVVLGVGAASAFFVDYLADRALARSADAPIVVKPVVEAAAKTAPQAKVAALAPAPPTETPAPPPAAPIEVEAPDPAALAKVAAAVGPEHAIELPTDDPTASPIVQADDIGDEPLVADAAPDGQPLAFAGTSSDETQTAAIAPDEAAPGAAAKPKKKTAKAKPAAQETEIAALPGVDIGGLAGHPSDGDDAASTVRTVTKPAAASAARGGAAARVTAAVNLRSSPRKGSAVIGVVPAGSTVSVLSCDGWCRISYNGRTGWIYRSFIAGAKPQKQKAAAAQAAPAAAPPTRKVLQSSRL